MIDRQSIANDLNAVANALTRGEEILSIIEELDIVKENMEQLHGQEMGEKDETEKQSESTEKDKGCSPQA